MSTVNLTENCECTQSSSSLMLLGSELTQGLPMAVSRQCEYCLMKTKYVILKEKNIFNRKYTSCVFNLFVLIVVSREKELLFLDQSTKQGDDKLFYVPRGMHHLQKPLLCIPLKLVVNRQLPIEIFSFEVG